MYPHFNFDQCRLFDIREAKYKSGVYGYSVNVVLLVRKGITLFHSEIILLYREIGILSKNQCYFHLFTSGSLRSRVPQAPP